MAKNQEHEKIDESDSDSSSSDNESSRETGSEESDSDSEPELTQSTKKPSSSTPAAAKKPPHQSASKPQQPPPTSSTEEEESDSDSESDSDGLDSKVVSKPAPKDEPQKSTNGAKKSGPKSSAPDPVTPTPPADEKKTDAKDAKKSKTKAEPETSDSRSTETPRKALFHNRLWSEEDETVILKGMIDYSAKKKIDPAANVDDFQDTINKDLHRKDTQKTQLLDKIRRLKKKYETNRIKEESSQEMIFSSDHEQKAYELSKSIWGNKKVKENGVEKVVGTPKSNGTSKRKAATKKTIVSDKEEAKEGKAVAAVDAETESDLPSKRAKTIGVSVEERISAIGAEKFGNGKEGPLAKEWNKLIIEEMQVYQRQLEVKSAQARVVIERLKSELM